MHAAIAPSDDVQPWVATLTPRERQVMDYVAIGAPNKAIARALNLSLRTVEHYRASLFRKLHVGNAIELLRFLQGETDRQGWRARLAGRDPSLTLAQARAAFPTDAALHPQCRGETP